MSGELIRLGDRVRTGADQWPPRNRRSTDIHEPASHVGVLRFLNAPIVLQRAGGPIHDWENDPELNPDLTPPHGIERFDIEDGTGTIVSRIELDADGYAREVIR